MFLRKIRKALIICNSYLDNEIRPLKTDDFSQIEILLKKYDNIRIYKYQDVDIISTLTNFLQKLENDESCFIYFSGHGDELVKSTKLPREIGLLSSWVNNDGSIVLSYEIDTILSNFEKKCEIFIFSDSCYSGKFLDYYTGKNPLYFLGATESNRTSSYKYNSYKTGGLVLILDFLINHAPESRFEDIVKTTEEFRERKTILKRMVVKYKHGEKSLLE